MTYKMSIVHVLTSHKVPHKSFLIDMDLIIHHINLYPSSFKWFSPFSFAYQAHRQPSSVFAFDTNPIIMFYLDLLTIL